MDERVERVLQSPRYAARAAELRADLAELELQLGASDAKLRLAAAKRLSSLARAELNWFALPMREYVLSAHARQLLEGVLLSETEVPVRDSLLNTLRFAAERFVTHPMWGELRDPFAEQQWLDWLRPIAASCVEVRETSTRIEVAYLLAICEDPRAWDVFAEVIRQRSAALAALELAVLSYPQSIGAAQRNVLIELADSIGKKHPRQQYVADEIRAALTTPSGLLAQ